MSMSTGEKIALLALVVALVGYVSRRRSPHRRASIPGDPIPAAPIERERPQGFDELLQVLSRDEWVFQMGTSGQAELDRLVREVELFSTNGADLLENLRCVHELYGKVQLEPKEGFSEQSYLGSVGSSHYSLYLTGNPGWVLAPLVPEIRRIKTAYGDFSLDDYAQVADGAPKPGEGRRLIGKAAYYEDRKSYQGRVEEYCTLHGLDLAAVKAMPRADYQASREVYDVYIEAVRPRREYSTVYAKIIPPPHHASPSA
jgi:hypothetical protein